MSRVSRECCRRTARQAGQGIAVQPLICKSTAMREVARLVERAAEAECPVFIWGEEGSGKKAVAETIHHQSRRGDRSLLLVEARQRPLEQLEKQLSRATDGGSVLIDGVNALPSTDQALLLKVAESYSAAGRRAAGGSISNFRLMTTARFELSECVRRGTIREDLGYRLAVVTIAVPPLRQRKDDIPLLVRHFLSKACAASNRAIPRVHPELMRRLTEHTWAGNARQLRECVEQMVSASEGDCLDVDMLPDKLSGNGSDVHRFSTRQNVEKLADLERAAMMRALELHDGNRTRAARALGISVRTLQRKLRHWGV